MASGSQLEMSRTPKLVHVHPALRVNAWILRPTRGLLSSQSILLLFRLMLLQHSQLLQIVMMITMVLTNFNLSSNFVPSPETSGLGMSQTQSLQRSQLRSTMNARVTSLLIKQDKPAWDSKNMNSQRLQAF